MGDNDWDLFAVVRGCSTSRAVNTGAVAGSSNLPSNDFTTENSTNRGDDTLSCLASLRFEEEDDLFSFPDLLQPREGGSLDDSYKPFLPCADPTTNQGIDPFYSTSVHGAGSSGQHHQHQRLQQLLQEQPPTTSLGIRSPLTPTSIPNFTFGLQEQPQLMQQQQQQQQQQQGVQPVEVQRPAAFLPLRNMQSAQAPRSRKRKNQQKKTICHVTADNLASDPWAWRKYGQKPIKGSSYPRNYYRCSSSKGCSARRQVERSHLDNNMFIVTYTGDHTHPKPTHRNSLAGSTRNKLSTTRKAARKGSAAETMPSTNASGSSPLSAASISPTTPLSAPEDANAAVHNTGDNQGEEESVDMTLESDEDDILIPNIHIDEDLFKGLEDLVGGTIGSASTSSGLGSNPAFGANFSSWAGNSTVAEASAGGGC